MPKSRGMSEIQACFSHRPTVATECPMQTESVNPAWTTGPGIRGAAWARVTETGTEAGPETVGQGLRDRTGAPVAQATARARVLRVCHECALLTSQRATLPPLSRVPCPGRASRVPYALRFKMACSSDALGGLPGRRGALRTVFT
jgi:hypothetical protein